MKKVSIVIMDGDTDHLATLATALSGGFNIFTASDPEEGLRVVYRERPRLVLTDLGLRGLDGLEVLDRIIEFDPTIEVIVMATPSNAKSAVQAIRRGASDFVQKPVPLPALRERTARLINQADAASRGSAAKRSLLPTAQFEGMVGASPAFYEMSLHIRRIAPHFETALLTGETGTGKDLAARALHNLGPASRTGPFVVLNCAAVVETLFESELFGHVRGSFTGADQDKMGLFEFAENGTILLDEIGDMPLGSQAKLLRTLQHREVLRVGSLKPRKINVRIVAATNRDLSAAVAARKFRADLYYRLSVSEVRVPPLSERKDDLPLLTRHMLEKFSRQFGKQFRGVTRPATVILARHPWPGNVRELENVLGHACMMAEGEKIDVQDLPEYLSSQSRNRLTLDKVQEKQLVVAVLAKASGNRSAAARLLHIGRDALRYKLKKYGLDRPDAKSPSSQD